MVKSWHVPNRFYPNLSVHNHSSMKPTIQDLYESGEYRLLESFKIDDMMQFLLREMGMASAVAPPNQGADVPDAVAGGLKKWLRLAGSFVLSGVFGWFVGRGITRWGNIDKIGTANIEKIAGASVQFLVGILVFFPLITVHEFTHGIFFKQIGAPRVGYGWSWKGMMAYAYAQNYVMTLREVAFVALMPFVFITSSLSVAWLVWPQYAVAWATLLFMHTFGCVGDFVLINFWRKNQHRAMFTYDDVEGERKTYFFERVG